MRNNEENIASVDGVPPRADAQEKQEAILHAAFEAFSRYGLRRTSMQDIADGAGMSRAALYLHFRNKEDIFRTLTKVFYEVALSDVEAVLALDLPPEQALPRAFEAQIGRAAEALLTSPHGDELFDAKLSTSADLVDAGEARLAAVYANWLRVGMAAGCIDLRGASPDTAAATMLAALHGLKTRGIAFETYRARADALGRMLGAGIAT